MKKAKVANRPANFILFFAGFIFLIFVCFNGETPAQTGGTYDLSHSVIASGGGSNSTGGTLKVDGTAGQTAADNKIYDEKSGRRENQFSRRPLFFR